MSDSRVSPRRRAATLAWLSLAGLLSPACGPSDPVAELRRLHEAGLFAESLELARELVETRPDDPEVHFLHGSALAETGQVTAAQWSLRKAMEDPRYTVPAGLRLSAGYMQTHAFGAADDVLARVLEVEPENVGALVLRALARVRSRRDYEGAIEDADRALEIDPDYLDAEVPKAIALLALERTEEAAEVLVKLERTASDQGLALGAEARYCAAQAKFAEEKGDAELAEQRYEACLENFPADFTVVEAAVEFLEAQDRSDRALEVVAAALEEMPEARGYRISLALRLHAAGRSEEAEQTLRDATELESPRLAASAWADLAGYLMEQGRHDEAIEAFETGIESAPGLVGPDYMFRYVDSLILAGRHQRAAEVADTLLVPAHRALLRGRALLAEGQAAQALEQLAEGMVLWPNNAVARYYAARAAEELGAFERAIEEYRYSIRIDPSATDARLQLARLHHAEGEDELALVALRHQGRGGAPASLEMALLELEILSAQGRLHAAPHRHLQRLSAGPARGQAVAALARGTRKRAGPVAAAQRVQQSERLDLTRPANAAALQELVIDLGEAGQPQEAVSVARAAVKAREGQALFHAILGLALEGNGDLAGAESEFQRTLDLDPDRAIAVAGLARASARRGEPRRARELYAKAAEIDSSNPAYPHAAVELLLAQERHAEAEAALAELLRKHPLDAEAALRLARLRLERGEAGPETLALARRAVRFGGGAEAQATLQQALSATRPESAGTPG